MIYITSVGIYNTYTEGFMPPESKKIVTMHWAECKCKQPKKTKNEFLKKEYLEKWSNYYIYVYLSQPCKAHHYMS